MTGFVRASTRANRANLRGLPNDSRYSKELSGVAGPWLDVQAMAPRDRSDVSTVFAISADPSFGVLVSFGIGGVATELREIVNTCGSRSFRRP